MIFSRLSTYCFCAAVLLLQACNHEVPSISGWSNEEEVRVDRGELVLKPEEGLLYHDGRPFTGLSVRYYADSILAEEIAYEDGKKHGLLKRWFPLGVLSQEANYRNGKLHGVSKTWWENGN